MTKVATPSTVGKSGATFTIISILSMLAIAVVGAYIYDKIRTQEITLTDANGNVTTIGEISTRLGRKKKTNSPASGTTTA